MRWYQSEDQPRSVREIVIEVPTPTSVSSKFGMLILASKYRILQSNVWVADYFRIDGDPGPYFMVRADGHIARLRDKRLRIAHCFYRMRSGGIYAIYIDFPGLDMPEAPSGQFVLFDMVRGIDMDEERQRILDGINRSQFHIVFGEGNGPGRDHGDGTWSGSPIIADYDVVVDIDESCRNALRAEWEELLEYHRSVPLGRRNFQDSIGQWQSENPLSWNPIAPRLEQVQGTSPAASAKVSAERRPSTQSPVQEESDGERFGGALIVGGVMSSIYFVATFVDESRMRDGMWIWLVVNVLVILLGAKIWSRYHRIRLEQYAKGSPLAQELEHRQLVPSSIPIDTNEMVNSIDCNANDGWPSSLRVTGKKLAWGEQYSRRMNLEEFTDADFALLIHGGPISVPKGANRAVFDRIEKEVLEEIRSAPTFSNVSSRDIKYLTGMARMKIALSMAVASDMDIGTTLTLVQQ